MNPFPTERIDGTWSVIIDGKALSCSCKSDGEVLAQIPVQVARLHSDTSDLPDRGVVASILQIGDGYGLMKMPAYRRLKIWFDGKQDGP